MVATWTDEQIARVFELCLEIAAVRNEIPTPPPGINLRSEVARATRESLEQHHAALEELGKLLKLGRLDETADE